MPKRMLAAAVMLMLATAAQAQDVVPEQRLIRLNTFPTARALPFYVGIDKGFFARQGIKLDLQFTENSNNQREGLAKGDIDIVHAAVDNALAMVEVAKVDVVIVSGGDGGSNEFIVQKGLKSFADVRGKAMVVDAPNTAYALQGRKVLEKQGLKAGVDYRLNPVGSGLFRLKAMMEGGDNAAAVMNLPFSAQAQEAGMTSLGRLNDLLGPYQAGGAFVLRSWAKDNPEVLERYLAGFVESLRWTLDPKNRDEAINILVEKRKLSKGLASRSYDLMIEPGFGFNPDAAIDKAGFDNVLLLRQEVEGGPKPEPAKYLDMSYYERALARLKR